MPAAPPCSPAAAATPGRRPVTSICANGIWSCCAADGAAARRRPGRRGRRRPRRCSEGLRPIAGRRLRRARGQLFQLLDLLQLGAARWWVTGTWAHFADQDEAQLQRTLAEWSDSDNGFAQLAFKGLTQPLMMAWYVTPDAGLGTGYPGPP
ncbi:hypothetical protein HML84_14030 [Alcanivorax sp. IO_7]|nr:hypothetical protein HML84_14030 [Alcanivorax sp. IO_7]